jgi:hypothetical protein
MALTFSILFYGSIKRNFEYYDITELGTIYSSNPSSSIVNDFIPYHALMSGKLLSVGDTKALLYNLDVHSTIECIKKGYEDFFYALINSSVWTKLAKSNTISDYRCRAGQLIVVSNNIVTPLMTIVVSKEHLFSINKEKPDYSKFFVVVSKKFSELDEHSNLYRNFCKYYLSVTSNYIDVIYTKDIISFCYRQVPIMPIKAKTIIESRTLYSEMTFNILKSIKSYEYT